MVWECKPELLSSHTYTHLCFFFQRPDVRIQMTLMWIDIFQPQGFMVGNTTRVKQATEQRHLMDGLDAH